MGFALSHGSAWIFAVFAALGLGLALPYLVVAAAPALATALPRPGPWMVVLRRVLGFALATTAVWLASVLATEAGTTAAAALGGLMIVAVGLLYLRHRLAGRPRARRRGGPGGGRPARLPGSRPWGPESAAAEPRAEAFWVPFAEGDIAGLIALGKVVFVDVTAEWCITCQINKTLVLYRGEVSRRLGGDGVVAMQADWTPPRRGHSRATSPASAVTAFPSTPFTAPAPGAASRCPNC